jgi:hypothetical protein
VSFFPCCPLILSRAIESIFVDSHDVTTEELQLPQGCISAFIGNVTMRVKPPVEGVKPVRKFDTFANFTQQQPLTPHQSHWIRLYYSHHQNKTVGCEVFLNNEPWEEMQKIVNGLP